LKTRDIPASKTTPDLTIPVDSEMLARDTVIEVDLQRLITRATGTRPGGTTQQVVVDRAAETPYGVSASTQDYLVTTDAEVQTRLDWLVNTRKTVGPRLPALKLDLLSASPADQAAVLALDFFVRSFVQCQLCKQPLFQRNFERSCKRSERE
jgi:hypothetical protein